MANTENRLVAITGMGALTPLGLDVQASWDALVNGRSGIRRDPLATEAGFPCQLAGRVHGFDPEQWITPREARRMPRFAQLALVGAMQATQDARLDMSQQDHERVAVLIGTAFGGSTDETQEACRVMFEKGPMRISPFYLVRMLPNMAAFHISHHFDARGYNNTVVTACASGTQAIGEAAEVIRSGRADVVITGGTDSPISAVALASMCVMGGLSTRNHEPERASRPFDRGRDGFVGGEGAALMVLESREHAQRRGARIYAEIAGYAACSDTSHISHPDPDGEAAARTIRWALRDAGLEPDQIDYINAHGTSTPLGDASETRAIKSVFGPRAYQIPISATKSMSGHMSGGSGAFEAVVCVQTIRNSLIHPTINYEEPDPDCDLDYVPNTARCANVRYALSNSFGLGGQNACLVIGSPG
jgi:3-oxoacyl-[acyl-carrier-protein] synthase II